MKLQKLLMSTVAGCCVLGAFSEAAMAAGCGDGVLEGETFDGSLVVTDERSCSIISSTVRGSIIVRDSDNVLLLNNKVGDEIRVVRSDGLEGDGVANVIVNTVFGGNLVVVEYEVANVIENEALTGTIGVNGNTQALVQKNIAAMNLICAGNTVLNSFLNVAGEELVCE